jgi:hypothetical protein
MTGRLWRHAEGLYIIGRQAYKLENVVYAGERGQPFATGLQPPRPQKFLLSHSSYKSPLMRVIFYQ